MKRLTERNKGGWAMAACCGKACEYNYCCETGGFSECKGMDDIIDRLAEIEDILGEEYNLDRMREIVSACKLIGKKVYINQWWHSGISIKNPPIEKTVYNVLITQGKGALLQFKDGAFPDYYLGKKIFTSKEEAKNAIIKERRHE